MKLITFFILFNFFSETLVANYHVYPTPNSEKIVIKSKAFADNLIAEVLEKYPQIEITIGTIPDEYPKLFDYLVGTSSQKDLQEHYYTVFHSQELVDWILIQPENSIYPHDIFREAIRIRQGDLLAAVITIHEVLRNYARGLTSYTLKQIGLMKRNKIFNKLVDIRGDLYEREPGILKGDHYGSWYRLWILMADQIYRTRLFSMPLIAGSAVLARQLLVATSAELVKVLSALSKDNQDTFVFGDPRKIEINFKGALIGYFLVNRVNFLKRNPAAKEKLMTRRKIYLKGKQTIRSCEEFYLSP